MVASSVWTETRSIWNLPLDHPIEAERGGRLATLGEVGQFLLALPDALRQRESWQRAVKTVLGRVPRAVVTGLAAVLVRRAGTTRMPVVRMRSAGGACLPDRQDEDADSRRH